MLGGCQRGQPDASHTTVPATASQRPVVDRGPVIPVEHADEVIGWFNKGVGLMDQFQPAKAARVFEQAVALAPRWSAARINLAIALLNLPESASQRRAEEQLRAVLAVKPDSCRAHYALGMLMRYQGRVEDARTEFERVLEIDPEDADTHYQLAASIADTDPAAARRHLEATLKQIPHHESACYRLQGLLRRLGEPDRAREVLRRFQALKAAGAGVTFGMKYGEMGRYANVVRRWDRPQRQTGATGKVTLTNVASQLGFDRPCGGRPGWPAHRSSAPAFGPGVAVADIDGDGDQDVLIPGVDAEEHSVLYLADGDHFVVQDRRGIDGRDAVAAFFGDYDADGDPDLYVTCNGPNRLYQNDGTGHFSDITRASGTAGGATLSVGAAWADADHDGDLDLYVANAGPANGEPASPLAGAPNYLWRNNGDGTFTDVAPATGIDGGDAATVSVLFFDVDADDDLDLYLVNYLSANRLFRNQRIGQYEDVTSDYAVLADAGPGLGAVLGDVDGNGLQDLLLLRGEAAPRLFLQTARGHYAADAAFALLAKQIGGAVGGLLGDLDLDGDLDLVLVGAGRGRQVRHQILVNRGDGRFTSPTPLGPAGGPPDSRGSVITDLDGDGTLELCIARAGHKPELWRSHAPQRHHWLDVLPIRKSEAEHHRIAPDAVGLTVEAKTGRSTQVATIVSTSGYLGNPPPQVHFGLGRHAVADYLRLSWPDAVLQSELNVAADQVWRVPKVQRKASSCPILFSWDGQRFAFVTDILGGGGLGFFLRPGAYARPDPTETVRIPPPRIEPRDGTYRLRIAEPLEEVTYLDQLELQVYDHPACWEVYPDERFATSAPLPRGEPWAVKEKIFPRAARDDRGVDVLDKLLHIDRNYVVPPADAKLVGYAADHWIELNFGNAFEDMGRDAQRILYLYGWVEYTYSHVNYAAWQAGKTMQGPRIEIPDGQGGWTVARVDAGFPAGLPRMMTLDISSLPIRHDGRLRIRTNMQIYWDQAFVGRNVAGPTMVAHCLKPSRAELRMRGYPQEFSPDAGNPTLYDYDRLDHGMTFKSLAGRYTRFGSVGPLLDQTDDQFVIMGRGEEVAVQFDAASLPELPAGWSRTCFLHVDGYCKDMDLLTAFPETIDPLPFHAMDHYPPRRAKPRAPRPLERRWNTRYILGR